MLIPGLYLIMTYLIGAIPTGYIVVKQLKGVDIRNYGSGNTGATNVKRVAGNKAAICVLIFDFFKGFLPVFFSKSIIVFGLPDVFPIFVALTAMIGHSRSIFLGFKGGKSAITGLGALFAMQPLGGMILGLMAFLIFKMTRFVSLASLTAAITAPIIFYILQAPIPYILFAILGGLLVVYLHKANIVRLIQGKENKA